MIAPKKSFWKKHKKLIIAIAALILAAVIACVVINALKSSPTARAKAFVAEAEKLLDGKADVHKLVEGVLPDKAVKQTVDRLNIVYKMMIQFNSMSGENEALDELKALFPDGVTEDALYSALQKYADMIPGELEKEGIEVEESITYKSTENVDKSVVERNKVYYSAQFGLEPTDAKLVKFHADVTVKTKDGEPEKQDPDFGLLMFKIDGKWYIGGFEYDGQLYDIGGLPDLSGIPGISDVPGIPDLPGGIENS